LTITDSVLSEALLNVPFTVLPFLSLTASLVPAATAVTLDQLFVWSWAMTVTVASNSVATTTRTANG
jgi:hypothetical protein